MRNRLRLACLLLVVGIAGGVVARARGVAVTRYGERGSVIDYELSSPGGCWIEYAPRYVWPWEWTREEWVIGAAAR